jgi:hypothetical protein
VDTSLLRKRLVPLSAALLKLVFATSDLEVHGCLGDWTRIKETARRQSTHHAWSALNEEQAECRFALSTYVPLNDRPSGNANQNFLLHLSANYVDCIQRLITT